MKVTLASKLGTRRENRNGVRIKEQIKSPEKLKLLVLSGSQLASNDFSFIHRCRNLLMLDLSDNELSKIPEFFALS